MLQIHGGTLAKRTATQHRFRLYDRLCKFISGRADYRRRNTDRAIAGL